MGNYFRSTKKEMNIFIFGLDEAGKSNILEKFHKECFNYKNITFKVCKQMDVNIQSLIFVVDSTNRDKGIEARDELQTMLNNAELREVALLVFANNQNLTNSMQNEELKDKLGLNGSRGPPRPNKIMSYSTSDTDNLLLNKGLDWFIENSKKSTPRELDNNQPKTPSEQLSYGSGCC